MRRIPLAALFALLLNACNGDVESQPPIVDTGTALDDTSVSPIDSTVTDSSGDGATDSGAGDSALDSGAVDSGTDTGTAPTDTGTTPTDTGSDTGTAPTDTGADTETTDAGGDVLLDVSLGG